MRVVVFFLFFLVPVLTWAAPSEVPQTGQTTSYATGDDGDILAGVPLPQPRFTDNGDGTVTDNLTGLIWLKDADCFGYQTWDNAIDAANALNSGECGLSDNSLEGDWRLPNVRELMSLIFDEYYYPALSNTSGTGQWVEETPFVGVQSSEYWSSTMHAQFSSYVWSVNFDKGELFMYETTSIFLPVLPHCYIWPVRDGQSAPSEVPQTGQTTSIATGDDGDIQAGVQLPQPRFTDNVDGTVTDNLTDLIWLKDANCFGDQTWDNALDAANTLNSGECGLSDNSLEGDWRLPNRRELWSLVNFGYFSPSLSNKTGTGQWVEGDPFSSIQSSGYWSSTTESLDTDRAWLVNFFYGDFEGLDKIQSFNYVWPVRGGQVGESQSPPGKAELIYPTGYVPMATNLEFKWYAVPDSEGYYLFVKQNSSGFLHEKWYEPIEAGCAGGRGTCSVTLEMELNSGLAFWYVQTRNEAGNGPRSFKLFFAGY